MSTSKMSDHIKNIATVVFVLALGLLASMRLMKLQVVGSLEEENKPKSVSLENAEVYTKEIKSTRGEIIDFYGNTVVRNTICYDVIVEKAFLPADNEEANDILMQIWSILGKHGYEHEDSLPISQTEPYVFLPDTEEEQIRLKNKQNLNLASYATAENCIDALIEQFNISDRYTQKDKRILAGIRYEMLIRNFSNNHPFVLARDIDLETIQVIKGKSLILKGVNVEEGAKREIVSGKMLPHEIGTTGHIFAEEADYYKALGYSMDDIVGKNGIEKAMDAELRGVSGLNNVAVYNGNIVGEEVVREIEPGKTVKLTVDTGFQTELQRILKNGVSAYSVHGKNGAKAGAIAVVDVKTGAVKGLATYPTYDLLEYMDDYESFEDMKNAPLLNRATRGLYRPGSTFKTITATAGLNEGIINGSTSYYCNHTLDYLDITVNCTGTHGYISVTRALEVSCNIFFYELSQRLTINGINKYASLYGLGQTTGLETGDNPGYLASPETFEAKGKPWYAGHVLQAGIGNTDMGITPLQMACVASTIANKGVRYKPYLVEGLYEHGSNKCIQKTQPTIAERIDLNYSYVYDYIDAGMRAAAKNVPAPHSLGGLGYSVAIKTGTPQVGGRVQDSFVIGYAPANNPEVAFCCVIEGGDKARLLVRDILQAYRKYYGINGEKPTAKGAIPTDDDLDLLPEHINMTTTNADLAPGVTTVTTTAVPN